MSPEHILSFKGATTISAEQVYQFDEFVNTLHVSDNISISYNQVKDILGDATHCTLVAVTGRDAKNIIQEFEKLGFTLSNLQQQSNYWLHVDLANDYKESFLTFFSEFLNLLTFNNQRGEKIISTSKTDDTLDYKIILIVPANIL